MEEPAVVPADQEEAAASSQRRRWGAVLAVAAGLAILLGTPTPDGGSAAPPGEGPPPAPSYAPTTTEGPYVPLLAGVWTPTWFPGEGMFTAVARGPDGGWVAAQVSNRGGTTTRLWRTRDLGTWDVFAEVDGIVTGLGRMSDHLVGVGAVIEGDPFAEAVSASPTVWLFDVSGGPPRSVDLGESGGVSGVAETPEGLVAVGWTGSTVVWPELAPASGPPNSPAAWWSSDGIRWQAANVDTDGLIGGGMQSVAATPARMVAGGAGSGRARIWESIDDGRHWQLVDPPDQVWPGGQAFRSVTARRDEILAVSATADVESPRAVLWRREPDGWKRVEPEGINEQLLSRVGTVDDEFLAITGGAYETSYQLWTSTAGQTWEQIPLPDPCSRCPSGAFFGPQLRIGAADRDLVVGGAAGQPVIWARHPVHVRVPATPAGWSRLELDLSGAERQYVVYYSDALTVVQSHRPRVLVGGVPVQPQWGALQPEQVTSVRHIDGAWYLSGWSVGRGPAVWRSLDGVGWRVIAETRDPVSAMPVVDDGGRPVIIGIGPEPVEAGVEMIDLLETDDGLDYVMGAVPWQGGYLVLAAGSLYPELVTIGVAPPPLPAGATVVGMGRAGDRLVLGVMAGEGAEDARLYVYDEAERPVAVFPASFSPWSLTQMGELLVATQDNDLDVWVSPDGERWEPIPIDPGHGFPAVTVGRGVVPSGGSLVIQGIQRGEFGLWTWTGPLPVEG